MMNRITGHTIEQAPATTSGVITLEAHLDSTIDRAECVRKQLVELAHNYEGLLDEIALIERAIFSVSLEVPKPDSTTVFGRDWTNYFVEPKRGHPLS